jgi:hypothetical protein
MAIAIFSGACSEEDLPDFSDKKGPTVISVSPADGATEVSIEAAIVVQFSEAILFRKKLSGGRLEEFDYGGFLVTNAAGEEVAGFLQFNNDTITFRGAAPFAYSTQYKVVVNERIKDLFGNRAAPYEWTFETEPDTVAPYPPYSLTYDALTNKSPATLIGSKESGTTLYVNGAAAKVDPAEPNFEISLALKEGNNTFSLTTRDEAGNDSSPVEITVRLDATPPASLTMCDGTGLLWHFDGREACWNPTNPIVWNNFRLPLGAKWPAPEADAFGVFQLGDEIAQFSDASFTYDGFDPRTVTSSVKLRAFTRDDAGNESAQVFERDFVFDPATTLVLKPNAMFTPSGLAETWTTLTAASLEFEKEGGALFSATLDGAALGACPPAQTTCTVALADLGDGSYTFVAAATDAAGNVARITKRIHVDTTAPQIVTIPLQNGFADMAQPVTLHVFANEPIIAPALSLDDASLVQPVRDEASNGRHWSYPLDSAEDGTFSVSVEDRAGNTTLVGWTFSNGAAAAPAPGYTSAVTGGTRDGVVTISFEPAPLRVVRWDDGGFSGFAFTTATAMTISTNPLTALNGVLETLDANGGAVETPLPGDLWDAVPTLYANFGAFGHDSPVYLRLHADPAVAAGFTVLAQDGIAYRVTPGGFQDYAFANCAFDSNLDFTFPLVPVEPPYAVLGKPCEAASFTNAGVTVVDLSNGGLAAKTAFPLWNAADETDFGASLTAGTFFENGSLQFAVGSPDKAGAVYLYNSTSDTAPLFSLKGDPLKLLGNFGTSTAFARAHHHGKSTLAVVAAGEPAIYFFENDMFAGADQPLPKYRVRVALEKKPECLQPNGRHEVLNAGDMNGDGGDDFVVASWWEACTFASPVFNVQLRFFYSDGEGAPAVVRTTYGKVNTTDRPRIVSLGDLDGDGLADVGHIDRLQDGLVRVYYGAQAGQPVSRLLAPFTVSGAETWVLAGAMDANGDGYGELILSKLSFGPKLELMAWP